MFRTSYQENNYGAVFQTVVRLIRPRIIVELGVLDGYSTLHLAAAAKWIKNKLGVDSHLYSFDLFEDYEFKHGDQKKVEDLLRQKRVGEFVTIKKLNAFQAHTRFDSESIGLLHIDISNDGDKVSKLLEQWAPKLISFHGFVMLEGGSKDRDEISWMIEYNKPKIRPALESPFVIKTFYPPFVLDRFPSVTLLQRRSK
jgi:hypothetical protein